MNAFFMFTIFLTLPELQKIIRIDDYSFIKSLWRKFPNLKSSCVFLTRFSVYFCRYWSQEKTQTVLIMNLLKIHVLASIGNITWTTEGRTYQFVFTYRHVVWVVEASFQSHHIYHLVRMMKASFIKPSIRKWCKIYILNLLWIFHSCFGQN